MYHGFSDALFDNEISDASRRKRIILPSSFIGGARYLTQNYHDVMAIYRWVRFPNVF